MDFDAQSSFSTSLSVASVAASVATTDSARTTRSSAQTKKDKNPVWKYCRTGQKSNKEDLNLWHCLQCEAEGRQDPMITNISTNIRNHLIKVHKIKLPSTASQVELRAIEQLKHLYLKVQAAGTVNEFEAQVF